MSKLLARCWGPQSVNLCCFKLLSQQQIKNRDANFRSCLNFPSFTSQTTPHNYEARLVALGLGNYPVCTHQPLITNHLSEDGACLLQPAGQQERVLDTDAGVGRAVHQEQPAPHQPRSCSCSCPAAELRLRVAAVVQVRVAETPLTGCRGCGVGEGELRTSLNSRNDEQQRTDLAQEYGLMANGVVP